MTTFKIDKETGKVSATFKIPPYIKFSDKSIAKVNSDDYKEIVLPYELEQEDAKQNATGVPMQCPLLLKLEDESEYWLLPFEPIITINGKNVITKKQVAKGKLRGSIKERWTQDDYQISISGIFQSARGLGYPTDDVKRLRKICEAAKVEVMSPIFDIFSIDKIVIESFDFPFTSGSENQAYNISAVSDNIYELLLKEGDLKPL